MTVFIAILDQSSCQKLLANQFLFDLPDTSPQNHIG
jgi:hypothetical protein